MNDWKFQVGKRQLKTKKSRKASLWGAIMATCNFSMFKD